MNEDRSTETGVQDQGGKPVDKASATAEQTDVDGVILLSTTKKYRSKRDPDKAVSGDEVWAGYSRGLRFDDLQSKHQKLEAQDQAKAEKLVAQEEHIAQLEADARMAKAIQNLGVGGSGQKAVEPLDDWATPGELNGGTPPNATPQDIASRFDSLGNEMKSQLLTPERQEQILREEAAQLYAQEQGRRDVQEARNRAADNINSAKLASLKANYPDISEQTLQSLAATQKEFLAHAVGSIDLSLQGDQQGSMQTYMDGEEKLEAMLAKQLELKEQQAKITAERERQAELEAYSSGGIPQEKDDEPNEPEYDWHKTDAKRETIRDKAKNMITRQKQLKGA